MAKKLNTAGAAERFKKLADAVEKDQKAVERNDIIPISSIIMNKDNIFGANDSEESIAALAKNIEEVGQLHNILVAEIAPDKYLLISGERRTKAMIYLGRDRIRATIRCGLSEFEILKMLFFANSETREYSTEEKVQIIESFMAKIQNFEGADKESVKKFKEYVAQAFGVSERQAGKLISITSELIAPLKELLYSDAIDINSAAALAQLPGDYQQYAVDIINAADGGDESKEYAVENALAFAKKAKNVIAKTNSSLTKDRTSKVYYTGRLEQAQNDLKEICEQIEQPDADVSDLTVKKLEAEKKVTKYKADLEQINKDIDIEIQKQHGEVEKVFNSTRLSVDKGLDNVQKDKTGKTAQDKKIAKEIQNLENALKKLFDMKPDEELSLIRDSIKKYKSKLD